jgi:hypothetical protein
MIDTIGILLGDVELSDNIHLEIESKTILNAPDTKGITKREYPLFEYQGNIIHGTKAYHNAELFNFTMKPSFQGGIQHYVQFSVPKAYSGADNIHSVGFNGLNSVLTKIEGNLKEIGVKTDLRQGRISRIDTFKNVALDHPYLSYWPIFNLIDMPRSQKKQTAGTFLFRNKSEQFCIYDKIRECMEKGQNFNIPTIKHMARGESRLLKGRKIKQTFGFCMVEDILKKANYDMLKDAYNEKIKRFFHLDIQEKLTQRERESIETKIELEIDFYSKHYNRNWKERFLSHKGISSMSNTEFEIFLEKFKELELEKGKKKKNINTDIKRLRDKRRKAKLEKSYLEDLFQRKNITMLGLYKEVKEKLMA